MNYQATIGDDNVDFTHGKDGFYFDGKKSEIKIEKTKDGYIVQTPIRIVFCKEMEITNEGVSLSIGGKNTLVKLKDETTLLLEKLGMHDALSNSIDRIKAPMPGSILKIAVEEGQQVQKGDTLLILEAMKMENVIKSPVDGKIARIAAKEGESVEKNASLIHFDR